MGGRADKTRWVGVEVLLVSRVRVQWSLALSLNLSLAATFEEYQMKRRHSVHEVVRVPT